MRLEEFRATLNDPQPPAGLSVPLQALWYEAKGDWERAHQLVQNDPSPESAWVHAYLHRKEGDIGNAHYWYRRASKPPFSGDFESEWAQIAAHLLGE
ncbi:MAG: hypothetical protein N2045_09705 [Fimbriimonadales bacterium]|jgi:hypothetical protein|nr:hypothetical protein [Armatimonadota bacterium]MCX7688233.1 hypothetical protein [Fimbriimonadales bacterium]CUU00540.1 hypothetical protein GBSOP10_10012 [Armatimonadetes bacterium GBS]CUU34877.1 hypothetical protein GXSOP10_11939 [Armatimonadetes bacterium GXS]CUU36974.1 hypothetical protein DCOP10_119111 [Armatimonadetes bacterium DC]